MLCLVCDNFDAPAHIVPTMAPALRPTQPSDQELYRCKQQTNNCPRKTRP